MSFKFDAVKSSENYFVDQVILQIPTKESQDPLDLLIHAEEEYIQRGKLHSEELHKIK